MKVKSLNSIVISTLILSNIVHTPAIAATTSTTSKVPYIIAKSTVDKVKAGTYAYKNIHMFESEKSMKSKLSDPIKMVQTGSKRVWYYKDFKVYTRLANTTTTEQDQPSFYGSVWGNGRYVYKIVVNTDYKMVNYNQLNAAYKNVWTKDANKIYAKIGTGNTEIKFDIPKWKTNPNTSYVKGYTIQIKHLPGFSVESPYVVYPKKDVPYLVQEDFIKSIKANGLNYKGIYLNQAESQVHLLVGEGREQIINENEKLVTYTIDASRSYSIHYKLSNLNTSMKPEFGFTEGQYYVDSIHINDIGNTKISGNMVGDTFKSSRIESSFGSSIEDIKFGLENLHVKYNMDVTRPDLNQVVSYSIYRHPRYDNSNYGPRK